MGLLRSPIRVSLHLTIQRVLHTVSIFKPSLDVGIIDICHDLKLLQLLDHAPQSPLLVHVAPWKGVWVHLLQTSNAGSFGVDLLELLCSISDKKFACFLKALVGQLVEWNSRRVGERRASSSRSNWKASSSYKLALQSGDMDRNWIRVVVIGGLLSFDLLRCRACH